MRQTSNKPDHRFLIAIGVLFFAVIGVVILSYIILTNPGDNPLDTAKYVFSAVLPLLGTWVGIILAFYFSRESFETGSQNAIEMVNQLTPTEKLKSIPVTDKMIRRSNATVYKMGSGDSPETIKIVEDILGTMCQCGKNRLPLLDPNDHPLYMIHRSIIDRYLAKKTIDNKMSHLELEKLSLQTALDEDAELRNLFENGFDTVKETDSLSEAKDVMDKNPNCLDVFITVNGTKNEPMIGWITNLIIAENSRV